VRKHTITHSHTKGKTTAENAKHMPRKKSLHSRDLKRCKRGHTGCGSASEG